MSYSIRYNAGDEASDQRDVATFQEFLESLRVPRARVRCFPRRTVFPVFAVGPELGWEGSLPDGGTKDTARYQFVHSPGGVRTARSSQRD